MVVPETGYLVKPETPTEAAEYTDILDSLIRNPHLIRQLGENSRKRIVENFSSKITLQKMKEEFVIAKKDCEKVKNEISLEPILRELMALATEYFRHERESVEVWRGMLKLQETHNNLVAKLSVCTLSPLEFRPPLGLDETGVS